jgi:hypothetical protein
LLYRDGMRTRFGNMAERLVHSDFRVDFKREVYRRNGVRFRLSLNLEEVLAMMETEAIKKPAEAGLYELLY